CGRIHKTGGGEVERVHVDLGAQRSEDGVRTVYWAGGAVNFEVAAAGQIGCDQHWEFGDERDVRSGYVDVGVVALLLRSDRAHRDLAVFQFELLDGEGWWSARSWRGLRSGLCSLPCRGCRSLGRSGLGLRLGRRRTESRVVPVTRSIADQRDL